MMAGGFTAYAIWSAGYQKSLRNVAETETSRANRSETLALAQRDTAYRVFLVELQSLKSIVTMLDNPKVKLANQAEIVEIQANISQLIQEQTHQFLQDPRLVGEKPELLVEMLYSQSVVSRMASRYDLVESSVEQLLALFPRIKNPGVQIIEKGLSGSMMLANIHIGNQNYKAALEVWEKAWALHKAGHFRNAVSNAEARNVLLNTLRGYQGLLNRLKDHVKAAEIEMEIARLAATDKS